MKQKAYLLIAAAGRGKRMGGEINKNYLSLAGKPILAHTLEKFLKLDIFSQVIVIIAPGEEEIFRRRVLIPFFCPEEDLVVLEGGAGRQDSIFNGLRYLYSQKVPPGAPVCIHDGVRPLVSEGLIRRVYQEALLTGAVVPAVPLKDTVKEINGEANVLNTPPRDKLRAVQTPQCFKFSLLWRAFCRAQKDNFQGSDDSSLVERTGVKVKVVPGEYENIKITTPEDLEIAEVLLRRGVK